ncbi:MAG: YfiR family protein [Deltaproteobacteria bacterium]|nr:YfiR family protein [Deltaproteobacteria bacterium]
MSEMVNLNPDSESRKRPGRFFGFCAQVRAILCLLAWLSAGSLHVIYPASFSEYQIKAAFLYNFAKFVDWPSTAFRAGQNSLVICVVGEDPFGAALDEPIIGQSIGGRNLVVRRLKQIHRDETCHLAFISRSEKDKLGQLLSVIKGSPFLTVGDDGNFIDQGGMINLVVEDRKVRFEVNLEAVDRAGLKISPELLRLAKSVRERRKL